MQNICCICPFWTIMLFLFSFILFSLICCNEFFVAHLLLMLTALFIPNILLRLLLGSKYMTSVISQTPRFGPDLVYSFAEMYIADIILEIGLERGHNFFFNGVTNSDKESTYKKDQIMFMYVDLIYCFIWRTYSSIKTPQYVAPHRIRRGINITSLRG